MDAIHSFHAHIYFDPLASRAIAEAVRDDIAGQFAVRLGRWHDVPVGPHPQPMYQVAFLPALFASFVPWLMLHRRGLTVLIHPNTGAPRDDHLVHAFWMGAILPLKGEVLPVQEDVAMMETEVNTHPHAPR